MQLFSWVIMFENGNQMGGALEVKTFEMARQEVQKIIDDIQKNLGYRCVEFTVKSGKLVIKHIPEV